MDAIKVGITVGDINGIGLEVVLKSLANEKMLERCTPVIYGSSKVVSYHKNIVKNFNASFKNLGPTDNFTPNRINVINCWQDTVNIMLGTESEESGKFAYIALDQAVRDLREEKIDVLVTAPVNKHAMHEAGFNFTGHTDFLEHTLSGTSLMMMVTDDLRIALVTHHVPLNEVSPLITREKLQEKLDVLLSTLRIDFGVEKPTIAVLGLNPHAGDEGVIGEEDDTIVAPVVEQFKENGHLVFGPFPADGFFGSGNYRKFDAILAMYHDQGLIPFKLLSFGEGVNVTCGLSAIRTSPDHGVAYDLAGKNEANETSFRKAMFLAMDIYRSRKAYEEMSSNPLNKHEQQTEVTGGN